MVVFNWESFVLTYVPAQKGYWAEAYEDGFTPKFLSEWSFDWQKWTGPKGHRVVTNNHMPLPYWFNNSLVYYVETYNGYGSKHFLVEKDGRYTECGFHTCNWQIAQPIPNERDYSSAQDRYFNDYQKERESYGYQDPPRYYNGSFVLIKNPRPNISQKVATVTLIGLGITAIAHDVAHIVKGSSHGYRPCPPPAPKPRMRMPHR